MSFLSSHIIAMLSTYLAAHSPEIQAMFLAEVNLLAKKLIAFVEEEIAKAQKNG